MHKVRRNETVERFDVPKLKKYIKLPYYGKISFDLRKNLQKILKANFPAVEFKFVFTNGFTIGSFFRMKDIIPESVCSNIVYKFECPNCHVRYLGVTSRALKVRIHEHLGKSHRTGLYLNQMKFSAIRDHSLETDHPFSEKDFTIVARFNNSEDAILGEKILIGKQNPELNIVN